MASEHIERDSLGDVTVSDDVYYGAQTSRAARVFRIANRPIPSEVVRALGALKWAAARSNHKLQLLNGQVTPAIVAAADEVATGMHDNQFVVDVFQTGSGTSSNMNANEVIAKRANELLTGTRNPKSPVHPNDHVNLGQSSNDVFPSAIHIAAIGAIRHALSPALGELEAHLRNKAIEFDDVYKIARTHLQDALPIRLGQEFVGYARMIERGQERILEAVGQLEEVPLGSTAVGTGAGTAANFADLALKYLNERLNFNCRTTANGFEALGSRHAILRTSAALKVLAADLMKIANDIRLLASGPNCGLSEIRLPELQPGSSMMPGKVNPVIAESMCQVAAQVIGNDAAITVGGQSGLLELNVMMPMMADNLLGSINLLTNVIRLFAEHLIAGLSANREQCGAYVEQSLALVTALVPKVGYDQAAAISQRAFQSGKTIREVVPEMTDLSAAEIDKLLDVRTMTGR